MSEYNPGYDDNKKDDKLYERVTKKEDGSLLKKSEYLFSQEDFLVEKSSSGRKVKYEIKDEIILRLKEKSRIKLSCWLLKPKDDLAFKLGQAVHITRRTKSDNVYSDQEITLWRDEAKILNDYLTKVLGIDNTIINQFVNSDKFDKTKINYSKEEVIEIINRNIQDQESILHMISLDKKKKALVEFEEIINGNYTHETDITDFLSKNPWLFGSEYIIISGLSKINSANILDLAPKTLDSFIDIVEVKLPTVKMFHFDSSHNNYYQSHHVTKAIAQVTNYINELETNTDSEYIDNTMQIIRPFATILIGSDKELNEGESAALRLINASYHNIRIITYQQLLANAKNSLK